MGKIRVRFAPSPTGLFHVGNLRTVLTDYLFARKEKGTFIVRIEDTDQERLFPKAIPDMLEGLKWAGIEIDEGVVGVKKGYDIHDDLEGKPSKKLYDKAKNNFVQKGSHGPYIQSDRLDIYKKHIEILYDKGVVYPCFCTPERLNKVRKECAQKNLAPKYDRHCLELSKDEIKKRLSKDPYVLRLKVPHEGKTVFQDLVRGRIEIDNEVLDDPILVKSDGYPTYHFAVVVDDRLMDITHVFRGEEWISSTPKHLLIYKAFGWEPPFFAHLPTLLNMQGKKLSKRDGDVSVRDFRDKGYLPEAMINFIALLGWNPKTERELFNMKDLIKHFDVAKVNKAGARFDYKRLDWFGGQYIRSKPAYELLELAKPFLEPFVKDEELIKKIIEVQKPRMSYLSEVTKDIEFIFGLPPYKPSLLHWKDMNKEQVTDSLTRAFKKIAEMKEGLNLSQIQDILMKEAGENKGEFLWPLRVAVSGQKNSPSPFECVWMLGKKESLKRIEKAIESLK